MANKTILMSRIRQILRHFTQGKSKKQISVLTGASRNTVKKYIHKFIQERITYDVIEQMNDHDLEQLFGYIEPPLKDDRHDQLQLFFSDTEKQMKRKGMTITLLWEQYHTQYPHGYGVTQFFKHYRDFAQRAQPVMHLEHKAGDKMYIDFAGEKLSILDQDSGEVIDTEVFVAVLGCSQLTYVEAVRSQKKEDLIKACENALHYFGGVPAAIVPDNLKSAVSKSSKYEPSINESFADFAEHYSAAVLPARAYRPKDKALVEGMVKIIYHSIYTAVNMQVSTSLPQLNQGIWQRMELLNNALFKGRDYSRRQQFEEIEKSVLRPLPMYRYEFKQQAMVTVMKNGHVCLGMDKHYYSVPYRFIGKKVKILFTSTRVDIYYHYERIASHGRHHRKYHYSTVIEHLASAHRYLSDWTPEKFIEQGKQIHEEVGEYLALIIETKQHPEQAYKSCAGVLSMARKVGHERLANACRRARSYGVFNYPIVVQILEKNLDHLDEHEQQELLAMPQHNNIRGSDYYE
jgi:transposase